MKSNEEVPILRSRKRVFFYKESFFLLNLFLFCSLLFWTYSYCKFILGLKVYIFYYIIDLFISSIGTITESIMKKIIAPIERIRMGSIRDVTPERNVSSSEEVI